MKKKIEVVKYKAYLSDISISNLRNCISSFEEKHFLASAVWGAVFLESFLAETLRELNVKGEKDRSLSGYISALNGVREKADIVIPDEIIKRCNELREKRNRLLHDTGYRKETLPEDAESIIVNLRVILDWYISNFSKKERAEKVNEILISEEDCISVFISTITPDTGLHKDFLETFFQELRRIGIKPVRAELNDYDKQDPVGKIREYVMDCEGMIVIGLERSHAYFLRDRVGGTNEEDKMHTKYTSGWLHLEAGIANALEKDIFVIAQRDICSDGIFDRSWNTYPVIEFDFENHNLESIDRIFEESGPLEIFFKQLKKWVVSKKANLPIKEVAKA